MSQKGRAKSNSSPSTERLLFPEAMTTGGGLLMRGKSLQTKIQKLTIRLDVHPTNRWTRAAGACFSTCMVRRQGRLVVPPPPSQPFSPFARAVKRASEFTLQSHHSQAC